MIQQIWHHSRDYNLNKNEVYIILRKTAQEQNESSKFSVRTENIVALFSPKDIKSCISLFEN